jgi:hypothetical protein
MVESAISAGCAGPLPVRVRRQFWRRLVGCVVPGCGGQGGARPARPRVCFVEGADSFRRRIGNAKAIAASVGAAVPVAALTRDASGGALLSPSMPQAVRSWTRGVGHGSPRRPTVAALPRAPM